VFDSYGRLSWNPTTRELEKIETQHADNKKTIKRHGGVLGEPLDDGVTAWKTGVRRPGFETLLERAGTGASQGIAVWHVDRLFRQPRDLERLIDLADSGFRVIISHGTRDLSNPDDRFILRIEVVASTCSPVTAPPVTATRWRRTASTSITPPAGSSSAPSGRTCAGSRAGSEPPASPPMTLTAAPAAVIAAAQSGQPSPLCTHPLACPRRRTTGRSRPARPAPPAPARVCRARAGRSGTTRPSAPSSARRSARSW
jgi:hypothetical protein